MTLAAWGAAQIGGDDERSDDSSDTGGVRWGAGAGVVHPGPALLRPASSTPAATPTPGREDAPESNVPDPEPAPDQAGAADSGDAPGPERAPEAVTDTIQQVFGPTAGAAIAVADCETGGTMNPNASNGWGAGHLGLFQISGIHAWRWPDYWTAWGDPRRNAEMAYDLSAGGTDWSAWSCRP